MSLDKEAGFFVSIIVSCLPNFLVTLPGTHARLLAVTWGKPVSGCFSGLWLDWIFFLAFWPVGFGSLPAHRFLPVFFFLVTHPLLGCLFFCHGCGVCQNVRGSRVRNDGQLR